MNALLHSRVSVAVAGLKFSITSVFFINHFFFKCFAYYGINALKEGVTNMEKSNLVFSFTVYQNYNSVFL